MVYSKENYVVLRMEAFPGAVYVMGSNELLPNNFLLSSRKRQEIFLSCFMKIVVE